MSEVQEVVQRLQRHLTTLSKRYPGVWKNIDGARLQPKKRFGWPEWCFMPMAGYLAILTKGHSDFHRLPMTLQLTATKESQVLAALAPWRTTQGIYRFHPEVETSISSTPLVGNLPTELFYRLPEWSVYVCYRKKIGETMCHGFFTHLEWDVNQKRPELRILLDTDSAFMPMPVHLDAKSIEDAVKRAMAESKRNAAKYGDKDLRGFLEQSQAEVINFLSENISGVTSLILYLCSVNAEISTSTNPDKKPQIPNGKRVKKGQIRYFPPDRPTVWDVGYRIGAILSAHRLAGDQKSTKGTERLHTSPRPHIRRAHWHSYWIGSKKKPEERKLVVKWLHPILVGAKSEDIVPTIRTVGGRRL